MPTRFHAKVNGRNCGISAVVVILNDPEFLLQPVRSNPIAQPTARVAAGEAGRACYNYAFVIFRPSANVKAIGFSQVARTPFRSKWHTRSLQPRCSFLAHSPVLDSEIKLSQFTGKSARMPTVLLLMRQYITGRSHRVRVRLELCRP